jgi:two-component system sensor histidine kinase CiaH
MIKALKRTFVLINMLATGLVLTAVVLAVCAMSVRQFVQNYDRALTAELSRAPDQKRQFLPGGPRMGENGLMAFSVELDAEGSAQLTSPWIDVGGDVLSELVASAPEGGNTAFLSSLGVAARRSGNRIAFVDLAGEYDALRQRLLAWVIGYLAALAAFFAVNRFLAERAVRPVEKSWEQQRQFVADASHELKTPVTVILANTDIQERETGESRWLSVTRAEAQRMKRLIEEMLFLAKSDAARLPVKQERVCLSDLVSESALAFEVVAFENGIKLTSSIAPGLFVRGDADMLSRMVNNLMDNAVKYTPRGGGARVELQAVRGAVVLRVSNSGSPIAPEHLSRLFDRFYRVDDARTRERGGYGLGLSIVRQIALEHGGRVLTESGEERGTVFTVELERK